MRSRRTSQVPVGQPFGKAFAPLHHDDGVVEFGVEIQRFELVEQIGAGVVQQSVDVDVDHRRGAGPSCRMHPCQHERRRRHRPVDIHRRGNSLGQHRFSSTERTGEHHDVAGAQLAAQPRPERDGVFDTRQRRDAGLRLSHGAGPDRATADSALRICSGWPA